MSYRVAVMRRGEIVETGPFRQATEKPAHAYTRSLPMASPVPDPLRQRERHLAPQASAANLVP